MKGKFCPSKTAVINMVNDKSLHLLRVSLLFEESDEKRLCELLEMLKKYPAGIYDIAFFTNFVHIPYTLEEGLRRNEILSKYIKLFKEAGYNTGINHLTTIGHHEEDLSNGLGDKYSFMTGTDGRVCRGSYCMNDENYLNEYIVPLYEGLAKADPDFILVDDDIRYGHMPIGNGCFCDKCIEKFNKENGFDFTRESLVAKLNSGDLNIRKLWLKKQSEAIENILRLIGKTVRSVNENIILGIMTGERFSEGYRFDKWAEALSDGGKYEIMWRPGGGAYTDYRFDEIVEKCEQTGRQNAYLPKYVTKSQYEIENFPYQVIKKTPASTAIEAAWSMTSGCTGAAFNILPWETGEPLKVIEPHIKAIDKLLPLYELLKEKTAGKSPFGVGYAWKQEDILNVPEGGFINTWGGMYSDYAREMFDFGLPEAYHPDNTLVFLGKGRFAYSYTDEETEKLLKRGMYLDAQAISYLNSRGFKNLTGFEVKKEIPVDAREIYTEHKLNEGIKGGIRNGRQAFNKGDSYGFLPLNEKAETLTKTIDYHYNVTSECALGVFENEKGGKIAAAGYYPFSWVSDFYKSRQIINLMKYLSGFNLPSYVESFVRIRNHTFVDGEKITVSLLNPSNENYENITVAVKGDKESATFYNQKGENYKVNRISFDGKYSFFEIKNIPAYSIVLIEA